DNRCGQHRLRVFHVARHCDDGLTCWMISGLLRGECSSAACMPEKGAPARDKNSSHDFSDALSVCEDRDSSLRSG
ncbi:MAG: hypothetical protein ACREPW_03110, partial [Candidatus Binataceae bacterium]